MTDVVNGILIGLALITCVSGANFSEMPQNVTLEPYWKPFRLTCKIDVATRNGMDWKIQLDGETDTITPCSSATSESYFCDPGYSAERPDNTTMNLIVYFRNSSVAGKYCCYPDDGQGTPACAYVTYSNDLPYSNLTETNKPTTATTSIATPALSIPSTGLPSGKIVGIVFGIVGCLVILVVLVACIFCKGCPVYGYRHNRNNGRRGSAAESEAMKS